MGFFLNDKVSTYKNLVLECVVRFLIQHIFDQFEVDWEEGDRENIKVSIQQPALEYYKIAQEETQKISGALFSNMLDDSTLSNLVDQAVLLAKRIRRF